MAVVSVPRPLRDQLGDAAADSLVDMLRHFEDDQEQQRAIQKEHLLEVLDERFLRHLAETEERLHEEIGTLRAEVGNQIGDVHKEIGTLRAEVGNQIGDVHKEIGTLRTEVGNQIGDVRKEIGALRTEVGKEIGDVRKEIGTLRAEVGKEIGDVHKEIGTLRTDLGNQIADVRKELNTQTRWILGVMVGATVLIPVMQRVMAALFP